VRWLTPSRLKLALLTSVIFFLTASRPLAVAQENVDDIPLGDIARSLHGKSVALPETVIDNDNLSQVVDDAESRREAGLLPIFSLDPGYNSFHVSSPDVTCSLSFIAKNASLSDQLLLSELPSTELSKLDGPAIIDGDTLQLTVHNGTSWELREVVIGLTIIRSHESGAASYDGNARVVPALQGISNPAPDPLQKQPDTTVLLRMKGSAAPTATAIFRTSLNFALFPDQEWHWAIVKAKGIPPQTTPETVTQSAQTEGSLTPHLPAVDGLPSPAAPSLITPWNSSARPLDQPGADLEPVSTIH
jgi:hypothetical protein